MASSLTERHLTAEDRTKKDIAEIMESAIESPAKLSSVKDAQNATGLSSSEAVLDIYRSMGTSVRVLCGS